MRNHKLKISDMIPMIPSAWFHKLIDMTKQSKPKNKPSSYSSSNICNKKKLSSDSLPHHFSTSHISNSSHHNSPRNSIHTKKKNKRKTLYKPSLKPNTPPFASTGFNKSKINGQDSSRCAFPAIERSHESFLFSFYEEEDDELVDPSNFKMNTNNKAFTKYKVKGTDPIKDACTARNPTKKPLKSHLSVKINKEKEEEEENDECRSEKNYQKQVSNGRKSSAGINLKRINSPRIQLSGTRRSTSRSESKQVILESFAVVKRSFDPKKDFRESIVEMIEKNNIKASKDLEDLLACYLSLNPKQYHDLIIHVFEQIWRQLTKNK